jgi:hypothetical protein
VPGELVFSAMAMEDWCCSRCSSGDRYLICHRLDDGGPTLLIRALSVMPLICGSFIVYTGVHDEWPIRGLHVGPSSSPTRVCNDMVSGARIQQAAVDLDLNTAQALIN